MKNRIILALVGLAVIAAGCSVEPKTGTRVVFAFPNGKKVDREQLVKVSEYLKTKAELVLGVTGPRVDKVDSRTLTLLLPGKMIPRAEIHRLIDPASIELYHLSKVATKNSPDRPWTLKAPATPKAPYLLLGPNAQRIESLKDTEALLTEVVGYPGTKPVLTGSDILPTAVSHEMDKGWAVQVQFTKEGSKILHEFTKRNIGEYLAVFYNGRLLSAPLITQPIPGPDARITGFGTLGLARGAVSEINAGTLPLAVKITRVEYYP